jgi:hypothetical protein
MYNHLKHVYVHEIGEKIDLETFKSRMKKVITKINIKEAISLAIHSEMNEDGFYLMDKLNITSLTTKFISGLDYTIDNDVLKRARFLFTEVVPNGDKLEYFIAGIDMNFEKNICLIMIKNKSNISKLDDEQTSHQLDRTINSLYKRTMELVITELVSINDIVVENDRKSMYELCKTLDVELLKTIRQTVHEKTNRTVSTSVRDLIIDLFPLGGNKPSVNDNKMMEENINSLLIGLFVKNNFRGNQLVRKAKTMKLLGYPTKIKFTSTKATRGATQSSSSSQPVSSSEMFHSLYISFRDALSLEQWSIAWFTDFKFTNDSNIDKIQTTIYSKSTSFLIIFKPTRPLNKEIIYHVVNNLNTYRSKKD